jgi:hypothetical protein
VEDALSSGWRVEFAAALRQQQLQLVLVVLIGLALFSPSLSTGYFLDDHLHNAMLAGNYPVPRKAWNLYDFMQPAELPILRDRGIVPWWGDSQLTIRFLRPLASLLRYAGYTVWGRRAVWEHVVSLSVWTALVVASFRFMRAFLPKNAAVLATAMLAWAPAHAVPLAWIANREALLSLLFGVVGLTAQRRAVIGGVRVQHAVAFVAFVLALASGEYAVALGGYATLLPLFAWVHASKRDRIVAALTFLAPMTAYLVLRRLGGFGARATGFYHDPFSEPFAFVAAMPARLLMLLSEAWFSLDAHTLSETIHPLALCALLAAMLLLAYPIMQLVRQAAPQAFAEQLWLLASAVLALVPATCVVPTPRVVGAALLGLTPLLAHGLVLGFSDSPARLANASAATDVQEFASLQRGHAWRIGPSRVTELALVLVAFFQLVHAPLVSVFASYGLQVRAQNFMRNARSFARQLPQDVATADTSIVMLRANGAPFFLAFALNTRSNPPRHLGTLAETNHVLVRRVAVNTLEVRTALDQSLVPLGSQNLFRADCSQFKVGEVYRSAGFAVTIAEVGRVGPTRVVVEVDATLDPYRLRFGAEREGALDALALPEIGNAMPLDP